MNRHESPISRWKEKAEEEEKDNGYRIYNPNIPCTSRILAHLTNRHEAPIRRWEEDDEDEEWHKNDENQQISRSGMTLTVSIILTVHVPAGFSPN